MVRFAKDRLNNIYIQPLLRYVDLIADKSELIKFLIILIANYS
jgi:hypothetical protein